VISKGNLNVSILPIVGALVATVALSSCAAQAASSAHHDSSAGADGSVAQQLVLARQNSPSLNSVSDSTIIRAGQATCDNLDAGSSIEHVLMVGLDSGVGGSVSGTLIAFGIYTYCPRYLPAMNAFVAAN
jgi:Protein of unknown function (DUF732)